MNVKEGLLRIARFVRIAGVVIALIPLYLFFHSNDTMIGFLIASIIFALFYGLAWIIEGFAQDK